MPRAAEDELDQRLRWMIENVQGAYTAVHPPEHPQAGKKCVNSGTCILVCCYINALGKVLLKGGPPRRGRQSHRRPDFARFQKFLQVCMTDFLNESNARGLSEGGDELLYKAFRCAFVHGYPKVAFAWGRYPRRKYWFTSKNRLALNINEFVAGFERGIREFRRSVDADPELRSKFLEYITA